jgi:hypothetical protein
MAAVGMAEAKLGAMIEDYAQSQRRSFRVLSEDAPGAPSNPETTL